ncbi:antibiotic biosynthesis monooxygenase [Actinocrinis puniceicyclus]|uniref:Antibiotic biosynthesis monooxygenase n=1 Tax=Actinocrinis puniceicyclus TaxID=977794 RepID=A0A8J7WRD5_9ACTN|nr:antibiotic biosynthesis monooxygenase family protein [Actinocrinis puniceicyclus]MBS2965255.1 antibiotic biosynthesis monooxygenase [Actinocrinis puniceicyclus]
MVVEHAELTIAPGREAEFEAAFARGEKAIAQSPGYRWSRLLRQVENPGTYLLLVGWVSLEAHTVEFRGSELFQQWRGAVGEFFAAPPNVTHFGGELAPERLG